MQYLNEINQTAGRLIFSIILLFAWSSKGLTQIYPSKNYTTGEGLPSNVIRSIYKDSRGLLWIGTEAGLCCYDGVNYKVYNESNGLKSNSVWSITEDDDGNLWCSLYGFGLAKFDGEKFTYYTQADGLANKNIRKLLFSKTHKILLIGTENGFSVFDKKHFKSFSGRDTATRFQIVDLQEVNDKVVITSSLQGIFQLKINSDIDSFRLDSMLSTKSTYSSHFENGKLFIKGSEFDLNICTVDSNLRFDSKPVSIYPSHIVWNYASDWKGKIYMATWDVVNPNGGLLLYQNGEVSNVTSSYSIGSTAIWCLYLDTSAQVLWVGTLDNGLYKLDVSSDLRFYDSKNFKVDKLKILILHNDRQNNLWVGAENYIFKIKPNFKWDAIDTKLLWQKIERYFLKKNISTLNTPVFKTKKYQQGITPFSFAEDAEGNVWLSSTWGVLSFDSSLNVTSYYYSDGSHIAFDNKDRLHYSNIYGNFAIADKKNIAGSMQWFSIKNPSVPKDVNRILNVGNNVWYSSYFEGLYKSSDTNFVSINRTGNFKEKNITDLSLSESGNILVASASGRVYTITSAGNRLKPVLKYESGNPLWGSSVLFIEDVNGTHYVGTNSGINIINNDRLVRFIAAENGLFNTHFNDAVQDKFNNIYIGTEKGLLVLNNLNITSNVIKSGAGISINSIKINGQPYKVANSMARWGNIDVADVTLLYNQNDIELRFAQNNIYNAGQNLYRYRIDGLAEQWSSFEENGLIQLRGISHGQYLIFMQCKNIAGDKIVSERKISLTILPPFWATRWFIALVIGFVVGALYLLIRFRINRIKVEERKKAEVAKRIAESKLEALLAQMNPHFTFNAINSIQNFIIDKDSDKALYYLSEFSKLIRNTLESSSEKFISLEAEIEFIECYIKIQQLRFEAVNAVINISPDINSFSVFIPPLVLQPIIENAFEHAFNASIKAPEIKISFTAEQNLLVCEIKDNGIGFINSEKIGHKSKGLQLVKDRLAFLNEEFNTSSFTFRVSSTCETGTTIRLTFLISKPTQ